jgi:hypothetical protein
MHKLAIWLCVGCAAVAGHTTPVEAQFGLPRVVPRLHVPRVVPHVFERNLLRSREFRRVLGVVAVATVGAAILGRFSDRERREISLRAKRVVMTDPDREVVESYEVKNKKRNVTIRAFPAAPPSSFKDDPALNAPEVPETPGKKKQAAKADDGSVQIDQVPANTQCRRVQTEVAEIGSTGTKSDAPPAAETNVAIVCEMTQGDWKPVRR